MHARSTRTRALSIFIVSTNMCSLVIPDKAHSGRKLVERYRDLYRRVHDATEGEITEDALQELIAIRDHVVEAQTDVSAFIGAFSDILQENGIDLGGEGREEFLSRVEAWESERKKESEREKQMAKKGGKRRRQGQDHDTGVSGICAPWWPSHVQNLMYISMRWPPDVLPYYEWNEETLSRDDVASLYRCAKKYPRFKIDFVPQANLVRWLKHCSAVLKINYSRTQEKHFAGRDGKFSSKDLDLLEKLGSENAVEVYGVDSTLATTSQYQRDMEEWTENEDSRVRINGATIDLKGYRKDHWRRYLLELDRYGMLRQREDSGRAKTPLQTGIPSPPKSVPKMPTPTENDSGTQDQEADEDTQNREVNDAATGLQSSTEMPSTARSWEIAYHHNDRNGSVSGSVSDVFASDVSTLVPTSAVSVGYKFDNQMVVAASATSRPLTDDVALIEEAPIEEEDGAEEDEAEANEDEDEDEANEVEGQVNEDEGQVNEVEGQVNEVEGQVNEVEGQVNEVEAEANEDENEANEVEGQVNADEGQVNEDEWQVNEDGDEANENEDEANETEGQVDESEGQVDEVNTGGPDKDRVDECDYNSEDSGYVEPTRAPSPQGLFLSPASLSLETWRKDASNPLLSSSVLLSRSRTPEYSDRTDGSSFGGSSDTQYTKATMVQPRIPKMSEMLEKFQTPGMSNMFRIPVVSEMLRKSDMSEMLQRVQIPKMPGMPKMHNTAEMPHTNHRNALVLPTTSSMPLSGNNQDILLRAPIHPGLRPECCSCSVCNDVRPVLERNLSEASLPQASPRCLSRSAWFENALWAATADASDDVQRQEQEKAEVLYFDDDSFTRMVEGNVPLTKPIIVRGRERPVVSNVKQVRETLLDSYGGEFEMKVTDALSHGDETVCLKDFLPLISSDERPVASFVPQGLLGGPPTFMFGERFRLLHNAMQRSIVHAPATMKELRCGRIAHSVHDLFLARVEASGAFCGPRTGILGGTWVHNLTGERLCVFVPPSRMTPSLWNDFASDALSWRPGDERRLFLLQRNDTLLLPPDTVYAQMPVSASASHEGSFWDSTELQRYVEATLRVERFPTDIPSCVRDHALDGLMSMVRESPTQDGSARFDGVMTLLENEHAGDMGKATSAGCAGSRTSFDPSLRASDSGPCRRAGSPLASRGSKRTCIRPLEG